MKFSYLSMHLKAPKLEMFYLFSPPINDIREGDSKLQKDFIKLSFYPRFSIFHKCTDAEHAHTICICVCVNVYVCNM